MEIKIMKNVLDRNKNKANEVRSLMKENNVLLVNLISSPGAGKTSLLDCTLEKLKNKFKVAVIEGDIATDRDAQRLKKHKVPIVVINTEGGCHLDSHSISKALPKFNLENLDVIFIENVGNLVCPSHFDLGESFKLALVSTTEGDDKPIKYPMLFREAKVILLNKIDLLEHTNFNKSSFLKDLNKVNGKVPYFEVSCTANINMEQWYDWISNQIISK